MTDDRMNLQELLAKASDTEFLRDMIGFAADRLMQIEVDALCGAGHGERSTIRMRILMHRNCAPANPAIGNALDELSFVVTRGIHNNDQRMRRRRTVYAGHHGPAGRSV